MSHLTGKRFVNISTKKQGVIVSEPFSINNEGGFWCTAVAVLWDDGTMSGSVDIGTLRITNDKSGKEVSEPEILESFLP